MANAFGVFLTHSFVPSRSACSRMGQENTRSQRNSLFLSSSPDLVWESQGTHLVYSGIFWGRKLFLESYPGLGRNTSSVGELIGRAYREIGEKLFIWLEGLSIALFDEELGILYLWRDWVGSTTIYHGISKEGFSAATSRRVLREANIGFHKLTELRAGYLLRYRLSALTYSLTRKQAIPVQKSRDDLTRSSRIVRCLVGEAVASRIVPGKAALLLSGGLDSTVLGYLLKENGVKFEAYTLSQQEPLNGPNHDEFDLPMARKAAAWLGVPLHEILLTPREILQTLKRSIYLSETSRPTLVDEICGMLHVATEMRARGVSVVYSGEGADRLFGSFCFVLRFVHLEDFAEYARQSVAASLPTTLSTFQRVFHAAGDLQMVFPYMYHPLATYALGLPVSHRVDKSRLMKVVLRQAFRGEIPDEFRLRKKGITRETTNIRYVLEKKWGKNRYRYLSLYKAMFDSHRTIRYHRSNLAGESLIRILPNKAF